MQRNGPGVAQQCGELLELGGLHSLGRPPLAGVELLLQGHQLGRAAALQGREDDAGNARTKAHATGAKAPSAPSRSSRPERMSKNAPCSASVPARTRSRIQGKVIRLDRVRRTLSCSQAVCAW